MPRVNQWAFRLLQVFQACSPFKSSGQRSYFRSLYRSFWSTGSAAIRNKWVATPLPVKAPLGAVAGDQPAEHEQASAFQCVSSELIQYALNPRQACGLNLGKPAAHMKGFAQQVRVPDMM